MGSSTSLTIAIVTKDRANNLLNCLGSLICQTKAPDELLIIDNNSTDDTEVIVKLFSKKVKFPIKYIREKKVGHAFVRNRAITEAKYDWIAFIDDDCVADMFWIETIFKNIQHGRKQAAFMGKSETYYEKNAMSQTTCYIDQFWKQKSIVGKRIIDLEILDTKNIVYNKLFLIKNKLKNQLNNSSHDSDLGMQIEKNGGIALFCPKQIIWHKDPINILQYYKKLYYSTRDHIKFENKWVKYRKDKLKNNRNISPIKVLIKIFKESHLPLRTQIWVIIHMLISYLIVRTIKCGENVINHTNNIRLQLKILT